MMIKIQQGREEINSNGGNILIGALLRLNGWEKIDRMQSQRIKHGEIGHRDILKIAAALLALGRNDFADVDLYRNDPLFKEALNLQKIPSAETLRQRLNDLGLCNAEQTLMDDCLVEFLRKVNDFGKIQTQYAEYIPLDIDVSVMLQPNCKKEGVGWTYHTKTVMLQSFVISEPTATCWPMNYAPAASTVQKERLNLSNVVSNLPEESG